MGATKQSQERQKIKFIKALIANLCIVTKACEESKIGRSTYYRWMQDDPLFKEAVESAEEGQIDFAEEALLKRIKEGSDTSIQFYLKTKGRKKGWGDNIDITSAGEKIDSVAVIRLIEIKNEEEDDKD